MSIFIEATDKQQSILRKLKLLTHTELEKLSDKSLQSMIDQKYLSCMKISRNIDKNGKISVVVKVEDITDLSLPESMKKLFPKDLAIKGAWTTDGFEMFPDNSLIEMHPDEFDDD